MEEVLLTRKIKVPASFVPYIKLGFSKDNRDQDNLMWSCINSIIEYDIINNKDVYESIGVEFDSEFMLEFGLPYLPDSVPNGMRVDKISPLGKNITVSFYNFEY